MHSFSHTHRFSILSVWQTACVSDMDKEGAVLIELYMLTATVPFRALNDRQTAVSVRRHVVLAVRRVRL